MSEALDLERGSGLRPWYDGIVSSGALYSLFRTRTLSDIQLERLGTATGTIAGSSLASTTAIGGVPYGTLIWSAPIGGPWATAPLPVGMMMHEGEGTVELKVIPKWLPFAPLTACSWGSPLGLAEQMPVASFDVQIKVSTSTPLLLYRIADVRTSTFLAQQIQIGALNELYAFRRPAEVYRFLRDHQFLGDLLFEAAAKIHGLFGPSAELFLEVISDPEEVGTQLVAFIRTSLSPQEALRSLTEFDKQWWLDASAKRGGRLCIHMELE